MRHPMKAWLIKTGKIFVTAVLVAALGFVIVSDYRKIKKGSVPHFIFSYLKGEREKVKSKAMTITINQYRPFLEQWSGFIYKNEVPPEPFLIENIKYYEQILVYVPYLGEAYHLLGVCYQGLGKKDLAIESFRKSIQLNPYLFWAQHNLGLVYFQEGRYPESAAVLTKAILLSPDGILKMMASSRLFIEIIARIQPAGYSQPDALKVGYRDAYVMVVSSFYRLGNFRDLLYYANQAIVEGFDVSGFFYYYAGAALCELKNYGQSVRFLEESLKKNPNNAQAFYYLGLCYRSMKSEELALAAMKKAEILHKLKAVIHFSEEDMSFKIF